MKKISFQYLMCENIITLTELEKKRFSLRKTLDNWFLVVIVCLGFYTTKIAADQLGMYFKFKLIENQRER